MREKTERGGDSRFPHIARRCFHRATAGRFTVSRAPNYFISPLGSQIKRKKFGQAGPAVIRLRPRGRNPRPAVADIQDV